MTVIIDNEDTSLEPKVKFQGPAIDALDSGEPWNIDLTSLINPIVEKKLLDLLDPALTVGSKMADYVRGKVKFQFYREGHLYYKTENGLEFPVKISDTDGATFMAEDKAIYFMRWIRKHLQTLREGENE